MIKKVEATKLLTVLLEPCSSKNGDAGMLEENPIFDIVEVFKSNESSVEAWLLEHISGSRSIFMHQRKERGYKIKLKMSRDELLLLFVNYIKRRVRDVSLHF